MLFLYHRVYITGKNHLKFNRCKEKKTNGIKNDEFRRSLLREEKK